MLLYNDKASVYGKLMILIGIIIMFSLIILPFYPQEIKYASSFLIPGLFSCVLGLLICMVSSKREVIAKKDKYASMLTVVFTWVYGFCLGASPFVLEGFLNPVQGLFEAVSGFTTTGLSVMDVTKVPQIYLFYRGFMQFVGGLGFVFMMIIFIQGRQSMDLYSAEGHPDKLMPNLGRTARTIFAMYSAFLGLGTLAYVVFGMPLFDSIIHTMCALSTGGFSTQADSIGAYQSIPIEAVTILLMLIGTTNFAVVLLLVRGKLKQAAKVTEVRFMGILLAVFVPLLAVVLFFKTYTGLGESLRISLFNVVSALSTSGFSTSSYTEWPETAMGIMILLMLVGGGIGSTAGGIKMIRVYLSLRGLSHNLHRKAGAPRQVSIMHYYRAQGKTDINDGLLFEAMHYVGTYMIIFLLGSFGLMWVNDCSMSAAFFEFASALGTVGLSVGMTGPQTPAPALLIEIMGMILGRLEIFTVLIGGCAIFVTLKSKVRRLKSEGK